MKRSSLCDDLSLFAENESLSERSSESKTYSIRQIARGVSLTPKQIRRAKEINSTLYRCGDDVDFWCEELGFDLARTPLPKGVHGVLFDRFIALRNGMTHAEEVVTVAHEICHFEYHGQAVAFREEMRLIDSIIEGQAELFAALVWHPTLEGFATEQEFMMRSILPLHMKQLRINLFYSKKV